MGVLQVCAAGGVILGCVLQGVWLYGGTAGVCCRGCDFRVCAAGGVALGCVLQGVWL
jgi:hypothetical protein